MFIWLKQHSLLVADPNQTTQAHFCLICRLFFEIFIQCIQSVHRLPVSFYHVAFRTPGPIADSGASQHGNSYLLKMSGCVWLCQGPQQRLCNIGGKGHEPGWAELGHHEHSWAVSLSARQLAGGRAAPFFPVETATLQEERPRERNDQKNTLSCLEMTAPCCVWLQKMFWANHWS